MAKERGLRTGFILDRNGNRLLPISRTNLILGYKDEPLNVTLEKLSQVIDSIECNCGLLDVETYSQLEELDVSKLRNGAICYVNNEETYYSYNTTSGWKPMETSSSDKDNNNDNNDTGGDDNTGNDNTGNDDTGSDIVKPEVPDIYAHIWVGPEPPEDTNMLWLDTNEEGFELDQNIELLYQLQSTVKELQTNIVVLENRVKYLEENGVVINPDNPPTPDEPDDDDGDILLLEDGFAILLEDGSRLLLEMQETKPSTPSGNALLFEDGSKILLEDGGKILLEM